MVGFCHGNTFQFCSAVGKAMDSGSIRGSNVIRIMTNRKMIRKNTNQPTPITGVGRGCSCQSVQSEPLLLERLWIEEILHKPTYQKRWGRRGGGFPKLGVPFKGALWGMHRDNEKENGNYVARFPPSTVGTRTFIGSYGERYIATESKMSSIKALSPINLTGDTTENCS